MNELESLKQERFRRMIADCFKSTVAPGIVAASAMYHPLAGIFATAYFSSQDSYKYTRAIKNLERALEELFKRYEEIERFINGNKGDKAKEELFPLFWDCVIEEQETDKIDLFVNGMAYCSNQEEINMEKMYVYFDVLKDLRIAEINFFIDVYINKNYKIVKYGSFGGLIYPEGLDVGYHNYVINKLVQLGLLSLPIIDGNGILDNHYEITDFGKAINDYFKE